MSKLKEKLENLKEKQIENDFIKQKQNSHRQRHCVYSAVIRNFSIKFTINNSASCKYFLVKFCSIHNENVQNCFLSFVRFGWYLAVRLSNI